ncbi:MAG: YggS family pyridoxal phosphate-dependent enzyme [Phascolarctobacterium sp.]|nr:YggS family pyridoxal phosphate-dependent enzyme [Phascolarctobacterium sp.]
MLADNLKVVREHIANAVALRKDKAMLTGDTVTLVAVTKNHPPQVITDIQALGVPNVGENRVQEAKHKQEYLGKQGTWHLIGHLQSNKARQAVALFDLIESIDSEHLLATVDKEAARIGKVQDILLQLNIAHEEQKSGLDREDYLALLPKLEQYRNVRLRGLMVIAQKCDNVEETRPVFAAGYRAFVRLKAVRPEVDVLSMGMSNDYMIAVEEGANIVRVGTALFGARDYSYQY